MKRIRSKATVSLIALAMGTATASAVAAGPAVAATCSYPSSIVTTTTASAPATVPYGKAAKLSATVDSGSGTPTGDVAFTINGTSFSKTGTLSSGSVSQWLGKGLPAQTVYTFNTDYLGDCDWAASTDSSSYKVVKAGTATVAVAQNINRGETLDVKVKVASLTSGTPHGKVRVALRHKGHLVRSMLVHLTHGTATASFDNMRMAGRWRIVARYHGAHNFKRSHGFGHVFIYS